jgi:CSLREA domain-containing protein
VQLSDLNPATGKPAPIAVFGAPMTVALNAGVFSSGTLTASTDSNGVSTFSGLTVSAAESSDYLVASTTAGPYTVTANSGSFDVDLITQTINITQALPSGAIYNGVSLYPSTSATSTSGGAVTFSIDSSSTPGIAGITPTGTLTITGPGTVIVDANQAGGGNYAAATQVQQTILVTLDTPAAVAVYSGNTQSAYVTSAFTNNLTALVTDAGGNSIYGATVTFAVPAPGASATLSSLTAVTGINGLASVTATANTTAGGYTVTASVAGVSTNASFNLTNLPSPVYTVTTLADDNPNNNGTGNANLCNDTSTGNAPISGCSLRDAIAAAAAVSSSTLTPTINFAATQTTSSGSIALSATTPGDYNVTTGGTLTISNNMNIVGPGANLLSIDGGSAVGVFNISSGTVSISGLTVTNGSTGSGGGIFNNAASSLTVTNSTFSNNHASSTVTHGTVNLYGGGIYNGGTLAVTNSAFSNNQATIVPGLEGWAYLYGGGIYSTGTLTVANSTFSNNQASGSGGMYATVDVYGGAISIGTGGTAKVINSTLSGNFANASSYLGSTSVFGGGIYNSGTLMLANTIVNGNWLGTASTPSNYDDLDDATGGTTFTGGPSDSSGNILGNYNIQTAVAPSPAIQLAPLGNYGGAMQAMIPLPGSAAICAGTTANATAAGLTTDQRGNLRSNSTYPGYSTTACVDAGAVQTNYSVSFTAPRSVEPSSNEVAGETFFTPAPAVTLLESGVAFADGHDQITIPLTLNGTGALAGGSAVTDPVITDATAGVATYAGLSVNQAGAGDLLTASLSLNTSLSPALAVSAVSSPFSVQAPVLVFGTAPPATIAPGDNAGTVTVQIEGGSNLVTTATDQITLSVTGPNNYSATYSAPASNGVATFNLASATLTGGKYTYTVSMPGANNLVVTEQVTASETLSLSAAPSSTISVNQPVTFTAQLSGAPFNVAPTGTVTFTDNLTGNTICSSQAVDPSGMATCTISFQIAGSHPIAATYAGDPDYTVAQPATLTQNVNSASTTTTVASSLNSSSVNQLVTFTATITPSFSGSVSPSGTVAFKDSSTSAVLCPVVSVISTRQTGTTASCSYNDLYEGAHSIVATYSGDANFTGSTSSVPLSQTVVAAAPNLALSASPSNTTNAEALVTFTAQLSGVAFTPIVPTGTVSFTVNGTAIPGCSAASLNSSQQATCTTSSLPASADSIVAKYSGDTNFTLATGGATQTVNMLASAISVSPSVNPVFVQDTVTYTAAVGFGSGSGATGPTGTVTFLDGTTPITACAGLTLGAYNSTTGAATAVCPVSYASVTPVTHSITATYSGDPIFNQSSSGALTETVVDFTVTAQNATLTVQPGAAAQYSFTLTPQSPATTFPTAVNLTVSGLPAGATYNFSPSATIAAGTTATNVTLNIQTAETTSQNSPNTGGRMASRLAGISLALLLLPFFGKLRKTGKRFSRMLSILLLLVAGMAAVAGLNGCGGSASGPPPQNYTVIVTATSGTLSHTSNITLTVE